MIEKGFVSKVEYIKHLDGDWRTVHNLWRHIRNYMTSYPAPAATTYTKTEVDAFFEGYSGGKAQIDAGNVVGLTQGSIPFADASGFLTEDNSNLFWDAANLRLGIDQAAPTARIDIVATGSEPGINIAAGANGEMTTPDGQQFRWGHWNSGTTTFTERLKFDAAGVFYVSYLTTGSVIFAGAGGEIKQDNAKYFYDVGNHWLALGHASPTNILHVSGVGTVSGWGGAYGGVIARFHCTESKHTSVVIDALTGYDPILAFSENGAAIWDIRNDASATDEFQIRYQVGGANLTYFSMTNAGVINIINDLTLTGTTTPKISIISSDASDPTLIFQSTFTDGNGDIAHEIYFALDQSVAADHMDLIGQTAAVDTYFHVIAKSGQVAKMGVQVDAYRGELICGSAGHISLINITEDKNLVFGIDDGGTDKTITWNAADDKLQHSHGLFNFADDNILTTGTLGAGQTTLADSTIADDARGLSAIFTLSANPAKSDGIAFYSEGHIGAITTDGPTYGAGIWLNIDSGATLGADVRALDIGIYEAGADCSGGNAYGLAIHMEFDDTNPPAAMYMFRLNTNEAAAHATPDALIFAANKSALAVTEGDFPFNNYLKIVVQDGTVYRIPLFTEGEDENICLHSSAELRFYDNGNYVGFEAPALAADQIWVLPDADGALGEHIVTDGAGTLSWTTGAGTGDVSAAAVLADHTLIRGNGGVKGIQDTGIDIDDADNITFPDGASINLQEDITFLGATTENQIKFPDDLPDAFSFKEAGNAYLTFVSTDDNEAIHFHKNVGIGIAAPGYNLHLVDTADHANLKIETTNDGSNAYLHLSVDAGTWSIYHTDDDSRLHFYYGSDKMAIDSAGDVHITTAGKGIEFAPFVDFNKIRNYTGEFEAGLHFGTRFPLILQTVTTGAFEFIDQVGNNLAAIRGTQLGSWFAGPVVVVGCLADGTCEIMKNEDALAVIDDILKMGSGKEDEYEHERMDMKKIHAKYPFMIYEEITEDEKGEKEKKEYFDKLGAKGDLAYAAIIQLNEKIISLENEIEQLRVN